MHNPGTWYFSMVPELSRGRSISVNFRGFGKISQIYRYVRKSSWVIGVTSSSWIFFEDLNVSQCLRIFENFLGFHGFPKLVSTVDFFQNKWDSFRKIVGWMWIPWMMPLPLLMPPWIKRYSFSWSRISTFDHSWTFIPSSKHFNAVPNQKSFN